MLAKKVKNKNVLFILPKYFGYENKIKEKMESYGSNVHIIFENLDDFNMYYRFFYVYAKRYKNKILDSYYRRKIKRLNTVFDIVFVIRGASLSCEILDWIKEKNPEAEYYMYQWDSIKNNYNALNIAKYFKNIYTFDMKDAEEMGWKYRPLFYCWESNRNNSRKFDLVYICSLHSQRINILNVLNKIVSEKKLSIFKYLYSKKLIYYKKKYLNHHSEFMGLDDDKCVKFKPLKLNETNYIFAQSDIVVDYTHPEQNGFTMRTIESIGHKCKLVTNNCEVLNSGFYNESNVLVYDPDNFELSEEFLKKPYKDLSEEMYEYYSLAGWLNSIIGDE